jgi:hypothetical protein
MEIVLRDRAGANIRQTPNKVVQRTAGGRNRPGRQVVGRISVPFQIRTYLFVSQAPKILEWAFGPYVPGGGTREILPSKTAYIFNGKTYRKFSGLRVDEASVMSEAGSDFCMVEMSGVGKEEVFGVGGAAWTSAIFPNPYAEPAGAEYIHQDLTDQFTVDGTALNTIRSLSIRVRNVNDHQHRGERTISRNSFNGRDITVSATPYSDFDTYYDIFRDQVASQVTIGWKKDNDNYVTFTSNDMSYLDNWVESSQIEKDVEETHTWTMHETSGTDPDLVLDALYTP